MTDWATVFSAVGMAFSIAVAVPAAYYFWLSREAGIFEALRAMADKRRKAPSEPPPTLSLSVVDE